jgi:hypothetical protein
VGKYRIDLVVEGAGRRLAIECEGDPHSSIDLRRLPEDMERQAILERLGWIFSRVRATEFLRDAERAMRPVLEKLDMLEILPAGESLSDVDGKPRVPDTSRIGGSQIITDPEDLQPTSVAPEDLVARVIRRAGELRQQWADSQAS